MATAAMMRRAEILAALDARPTPAAYARAARELSEESGELPVVRIALLSSFTIDPLVPYLTVECARRGMAADLYVGAFNSVHLELVAEDSGCVAHRPDAVFVVQLLDDVSSLLTRRYLEADDDAIEREIEQIRLQLKAGVAHFRGRSGAAVLLHTFPLPAFPALGVYEPLAEQPQTAALRRMNVQMTELTGEIPGTYILDFDRVCADVGYLRWRDAKGWALGRAPLSSEALVRLAVQQTTFLQALRGGGRKCLVVDLDDTLWGGVVGEVGLGGLALGSTFPGNAYQAFQDALLQLRQRGVLLAIASKNNPADVDEVFDRHPEMRLQRTDFAAMRIGWQPKPQSLVEIAAELNIGVDSVAFFDDNPAERALVRQTLPEVLTFDVPLDPLAYAATVLGSGAFDRLSLSAEDRQRTALYHAQVDRKRLAEASGSVEGFLATLDMEVHVQEVDSLTFARAVELLHKTNQFNVTTRRHSAAELQRWIGRDDCAALIVRVVDRFGDQGLVGLALIRSERETAIIDTFLLSCRVIGRQVETALLSAAVDWARARGVRRVDGEFIPTAKNAPARDFYRQQGFTPAPDGGSHWHLDVASGGPIWPSFIRRTPSPAHAPVS